MDIHIWITDIHHWIMDWLIMEIWYPLFAFGFSYQVNSLSLVIFLVLSIYLFFIYFLRKTMYGPFNTHYHHVLFLIKYTIWISHDDVIKWINFLRYWPFVRGLHRSPVNSPHKGQWRGALIFSLIYTWINGWVNNGAAGDLRHYRAHYYVTVIKTMNELLPGPL